MYLCIQADEVHVRAGGCGGDPDCGIATLDNDDFRNVLADGFFGKHQSKKHTGYLSIHTIGFLYWRI